MKTVTLSQLRALDPLDRLSAERLSELASFCNVEWFPADVDPFRLQGAEGRANYLLSGALQITRADGANEVVRPLSGGAQRPIALDGEHGAVDAVVTLEPSELIRIDLDLLDIMLTWSQIAAAHPRPEEQPVVSGAAAAPPGTGARPDLRAPEPSNLADWNMLSGIFSVESLTTGTFASLPPAHISGLLQRFERVDARRGEVVLREGDPGDYYYVLNTGRAQVTRMVGGVSMPLADLKSGDAFGEEALISDGRRNATVTMKSDGSLLRLAKNDFVELLRKPLLNEIDAGEARRRVATGARWIDVRFPSEYQHDKIPGAMNIPLGELRHAFGVLGRDTEYIVYCQSGRRSAAAAFLLAQHGFKAAVLSGGLWAGRDGA